MTNPRAASDPPVLSVESLRFERGSRHILDNINWQVRAGEHWVILGPNGCGKTSLINLLTGYDMATAGDIRVGDATFGEADWREVRKRIGLVGSTLTFYLEPNEPVIDAVVSGREAMINLIGDVKPALDKEARALLKQFGCGHLVESRWGVLSQGERQKILICRAMMAKFQVLILDEPCAGLDPVAREHFLTWLQKLATRKDAPSLVLVTHHVEEILACFNRVLLMKEGKVLAAGETVKVLTSANLSEAYGAKLKLESSRERYRLQLQSV
ncbi:MAG: ATP-binding cassette domain-containing protein [Verrucomicrobia bacterium]|nr:ATP-binding cassette domain-containing protein [Verrucomicrobiota bacterium]